MDITTLTIPPSPSRRGKFLKKEHLGLQPIELVNGCNEEGIAIDSDDIHLTNLVRMHFLYHFGHRDLEGIVSDYSEHAVMVNVVNGERKSYHGLEEIRGAFQEVFKQHPTVNSSFHLKDITIHDRSCMIEWCAMTPTQSFPSSSDKIVYDKQGKIVKQFLNCEANDLEVPWYSNDE